MGQTLEVTGSEAVQNLTFHGDLPAPTQLTLASTLFLTNIPAGLEVWKQFYGRSAHVLVARV